MEERQRRKLAVILHADVVGSTTLVHRNETLAHDRIQDSFRRFSETIKAYGGFTHELRGDALVAEFARASDAVCAALSFQHEHTQSLLALSDDIKPTIRIGISLGEVVFDDNTVTGGGVILAQRVEQLAEPGGLCITAAIHEALPQHMPFDQYDLGEQEVKGFEEAIRVYRVALKSGQVVPAPEKAEKPKSTNTLGISAAIAALVLVVAGGIALWLEPWQPEEEPASIERMAFPLPDKPSIAVVPFDNLSGDTNQDPLTDGLTEEIITTLSKSPNLFVIARNSTFTYKGKAVEVRQVAEEQGVRYVLKGSVQRSGEKIRINAQLIDALEGHHLWAQRYDRDFSDIFALQDDITQNIMIVLEVELTQGEEVRLMHSRAHKPEAFEYMQRSRAHYYRYNKEDNAIARELAKKAAEVSPEYPDAWQFIGWNHLADYRFGWSADREEAFRLAKEVAEKAYALDPRVAGTNGLLGALNVYRGQYDEGISYFREGVKLAPSEAIVIASLAWAHCYAGDPEEAIPLLQTAMRLSPYYPAWFIGTLGLAYMMIGDFTKAIAAHEQLLERKSMLQFAYSRLAAIYAVQGNNEKARAYAAELIGIKPDFTISDWSKSLIYQNQDDLEWELNALRKAGLPENPPLELPAKPSIAVLPFTNMSSDPDQEYFADGITEDITTDLSKIPGLYVIARNSAFTYKGKAVKPDQIGKELGVQYILEGSVRRAKDDVRVNVQLIDSMTGGHLWAERFDGSLMDIFSVQDSVTRKVVAALEINLVRGDTTDVHAAGTRIPQAYDAVLQGWEYFRRRTPEDSERAIEQLEKAIGLDPDYGRAYAALAAVYWNTVTLGWEFAVGKKWEYAYEQAIRNLEIALQTPTALAYSISAEVMVQHGNHREALEEVNRAINLNPNDADIYISKARVLNAIGRAKEAEDSVQTALRLNPHYQADHLRTLGRSLFHQQRYSEAAETLERVVNWQPDVIDDYATLVAIYGHLGQIEKAKNAIQRYNEIAGRTGYTPISVQEIGYWWYGDLFDYDQAYRMRLLAGLRAGGAPEGSENQDTYSAYRNLMTRRPDGIYDVEGSAKIDAATAKELHERGVAFVDVRDSGSFARGHIPGAIHLELNTALDKTSLTSVVDQSVEVVIHCWGRYCPYSAYACAKATLWGFERVYRFEDGYPGWEAAGYPIETLGE